MKITFHFADTVYILKHPSSITHRLKLEKVTTQVFIYVNIKSKRALVRSKTLGNS